MPEIFLSSAPRRRFPWLVLAAIALAALGAAAGWWWAGRASDPAASLDPRQRAAFESVVRDYILAHPEILPEAMERLQSRRHAEQVGAERAALETPFEGAVLGNPQGKLTLVQFTDYACVYCRASVADLEALAAAHPDLKIVIRELPILSPASEQAARMALAAARQGRYAAFHRAMFAGAKPDAASIEAAARAAGVDVAAATSFARDEAAGAELSKNLALASRLGIGGTPAWVVGDQLLVGAVGRAALERAIAETRKSA